MTMDGRRQFTKGLRSRLLPLLPWLVLLLGILLSGYLAERNRLREEKRVRSEFGIRLEELAKGVERRLISNAQILRGVAGLFAAHPELGRDDFRRYVARLNLPTDYPDIQGIGYVQLVPARDRARHVAAMRAQGLPDYDIHPAGKRDPYTAVTLVEPLDWRNRRALGFDMSLDPSRMAVAAAARDEGRPAMTDRVTLRQETAEDIQAGVLVFVPVYRHFLPLETVAQRRAALQGWAYSPLRMTNMMTSYLTNEYPELLARISLDIYSGDQPLADALLFASRPGLQLPDTYRVSFTANVLERPWLFQATLLPNVGSLHQIDIHSRTLLLTGLALSVLLALAGRALVNSHLQVTVALEKTSLANASLAEQGALLQTIYDSSGIALLLLNKYGVIVHANQHSSELFRRPHEQLIDSVYYNLIAEDERHNARQFIRSLLTKHGSPATLERQFRRQDGSIFWGQVTSRAIPGANGQSQGIVLAIEDISERHATEAHIQHLAHHDPLTGLANRALLVKRAEQALLLAKRYKRRLAILFVDLDRFKPINDRYGHELGDAVLTMVARRMRELVRESDTVCRQGGDEFVLLLPEFHGADGLEQLARDLIARIEEPCQVEEHTLHVSASIGIATYPEDGDTVEAIIRRADAAMYQAKGEPAVHICFARELERPSGPDDVGGAWEIESPSTDA